MKVIEAKATAREWVAMDLERWPGLCAAHLVGGVTTMPADAPFPPTKDIDLHLIFEEGSPALEKGGPHMNIVNEQFGGIAIEAGIKPVALYRSTAIVVSNPEIAHHFTTDCILYDPTGMLSELQAVVKREYPRRRWVLARIDFERTELERIIGLAPMASSLNGASGEVNMLGYSSTRLNAVLHDAMLKAPQMGSRMFVRLRGLLSELGRLDLYEEILALLGIQSVQTKQVEQLVDEGAEAFDLAVRVRRTPHGFQHKLQRHVRPYFIDSCQQLLAEGFHREACGLVFPVILASSDVVLADGPDEVKSVYAARQSAFLRLLGLDTAAARKARFAQARLVHDRVFALARETVALNPAVVD